jgi:WhiB family transcriptional regulator, redox-sensing transcriptional regulator
VDTRDPQAVVAMTDSSWWDWAGCIGVNTELFFPIGSTGPAVEQADQAKTVCAGCPVRDKCLDYVLAMGQHDGIWGGLSEDERRRLRRSRQRGQRGKG